MQRRARARAPGLGSFPALGIALAALLLSGCRAPAPEIRLLLLLTVDTLRADHLAAYGDDRGLSPHLDALAAESVVFERAYAPAPFTLPSIGALFAGRPPEELGLRSNRAALPADVPTLATLLRGDGWCTRAVVSNFVLRRNAGIDRGFERYDDTLPGIEPVRKWPERRAAATTDAALAVLDALPDARCFLWVHYQDPHGPYTPPEGERERFLRTERERPGGTRRLARVDAEGIGGVPAYQALGPEREVAFYRAGYAGEIAYADREIGRLLEEVRARDLDDRTLLVFTADHGESLGEGDYWFAHGARLSEASVRVPLFFRIPGKPAGRRRDVVWLVDLLPTLAARVGIPSAPDAPGRDLFAAGAETEASAPYLSTLAAGPEPRFGLVEGEWKLIREGPGQTRLFRVGRAEEAHPTDPERTRAMTERLFQRRAALRARPFEARQRISEGDAEKLRALGYLEPGEDESEP